MQNNIEKICIAPNSSILEAIAVIDKIGLQLALVVDENKVLLGTVTDGDIRRALLNKYSLNDCVSVVMNKDYKYITEESKEKDITKIMKKYSIFHLPIVNNEKILVDLKLLKDQIGPREMATPIVIMAGGKGKRLIPLTNSCPKPMLKIGDKPILEIIINQCIEQGFRSFFISVNYLKEQIIDYFGDGSKWKININYLIEEEPLGTAGSLNLLPKNIHENLIIINGDILTNFDLSKLVEFHKEHKAQATMCARKHQIKIPFGVIETDGINIINIDEKPSLFNYVNAGVYMIDKSIIKLIPEFQYLDMPELFLISKSSGNKVVLCPIHEYWKDIGKIESLETAYTEWPKLSK